MSAGLTNTAPRLPNAGSHVELPRNSISPIDLAKPMWTEKRLRVVVIKVQGLSLKAAKKYEQLQTKKPAMQTHG
jgi:hypothetical protein